jgi:ribosomal protein S18 acetylase RimI-like enzyme
MPIIYYKRYRMEIDLNGLPPVPPLHRPLEWVRWDESLLVVHADVKSRAFLGTIDAEVFPSLGGREGCLRLMREIRRKGGFLPGATWLIRDQDEYCAAIQGVIDYGPVGAIQNVGVVPEWRGRGLGHLLVARALEGFRLAGLRRAYLEVTAENAGAVRLYRHLGFHKAKTLYKAVGPAEPIA